MSLQEIERSHIVSGQVGYKKSIDVSSEKMMLDILQVSQYSKPIESQVRELASNAVDSQKEKEIALKILSGENVVSDFFIEREGSQYDASKFDPSYFDPKHLDQINNTVEIHYTEKEGNGYCDEFTVIDRGVGLGGNRLKGYLTLGYSTKRNTKHALGAYGIGAKSPLAGGAPFYTVDTVHNGKRVVFNAYAYKVDFIVPKWDLERGVQNKEFNVGTEEEPHIAYYEETTSKNYTKVTSYVKRHNRQKYIQAVKHQLLYFKGVDFLYTDEAKSTKKIQFLATIVHNSPSLIISENNQFSRPHAVIVKDKDSDFGVTYGLIDFQELEMETYFGSIGFKLPVRSVYKDANGEDVVVQEGVTTTPSRESIVWDEYTKAYVKQVIEEAREEAGKIIEGELQETNLYAWLGKVHSIIHSYSGSNKNKALSILSHLVEKDTLKPKFAGNPKIKYDAPSKIALGLDMREITESNGHWNSKTSSYKINIERSPLMTWGNFNFNSIYIKQPEERFNHVKDRYLTSAHGGRFTVISILDEEGIRKKYREDNTKAVPNSQSENSYVEKSYEIQKYFLDNIPNKKFYDSVEVPQSFNERILDEDKAETSDTSKAITMTPAELREFNGTIVANTIRYDIGSGGVIEQKLTKVEPLLADLDKIEAKVVWGTQEDESKIKMLCDMFYNISSRAQRNTSRPRMFFTNGEQFYNKDHTYFLKVSKRNVKHFKQIPTFIHVDKYLLNHTKDSFNVGDFFVKHFTAKYLSNNLQEFEFLCNFKEFNSEAADAYAVLDSYKVIYHDSFISSKSAANDDLQEFFNLANKGLEFQIFLRSNPSEAEIEEMSNNLFGTPRFKSAKVVDSTVIELLEELSYLVDPVKDLFNEVKFLTIKNAIIHPNGARLVKEILSLENLENFELSEESKTTVKNLK